MNDDLLPGGGTKHGAHGHGAVRVLVLGGTAEAREIATVLVAQRIAVVSSLAGRVSRPRLPVGEVRIGGFGGVEGLVTYLRSGAITHIVDATHPFAVTMRQHAVAAADELGVPILRLSRPGWRRHPDAQHWRWVETYEQADRVAAELGTRPFITSGRQTLPYFTRLREASALVRVVEPLEPDMASPRWTIREDRGPFSLAGELEVMRAHQVDVLVTKDSGGSYTAAKLDAARELQIPVVVVARPASPPGLPECASTPEVLEWLGAAQRTA